MPAGDAHGQREPTGRVIASCSSVLGVQPQRAQRPTAGAWVAGPRRSVVLVLERSHALTLRPRLRSLRYGRQKPTARSAAGTQDGSAPETCGRRGGSTPEEAAEQIAAGDLPRLLGRPGRVGDAGDGRELGQAVVCARQGYDTVAGRLL